VRNGEKFNLTLLDDVWLSVIAPNAEVSTEGPYAGKWHDGWIVYLRCPSARTIPVGTEIEIPFDSCAITTYEPGPGALLKGVRVIAREGYRETNISGGIEMRRAKRWLSTRTI
jgi:hypothetical protein